MRVPVLVGMFMLVSVACSSSAADPGEVALDEVERLTGLRADLGWSVREVLFSDDGDCAAVDLVADSGMEAGMNLANQGGRWVGVVATAGVGHVAAHRIGVLEFGDDCEHPLPASPADVTSEGAVPGEAFADSTAGSSTIVLTYSESVTPGEFTDALFVINDRLAQIGLGYVKAESDSESITVSLPAGWDGEAVALVLGLPGELSLRSVLDVAEYDGQSTSTLSDNPGAESWLLDQEGASVYHLGPARVVASDIDDASIQLAGPASQWVVQLEFTEDGADQFQEVTRELAGFPLGDVRRQIAIVLDGVVRSAPTMAPGVDPTVGITGGTALVTLGSAESPQAEAEALAVALRTSPLPVPFESISVESS